MWDLPRPGVEPVSPALTGGFFATGPPEESPMCILSPAALKPQWQSWVVWAETVQFTKLSLGAVCTFAGKVCRPCNFSSLHHPGSSPAVCACMLSHFSCVWLFVTLWTVAPQAPLSMGFSRQEEWSGLPCLPPGDLPNPGIELTSHYVSCIGRWVLYYQVTWEAPQSSWAPSILPRDVSTSLLLPSLTDHICPGARVSSMPPSRRPCKHHCGWCVQSSIQMSPTMAPLAQEFLASAPLTSGTGLFSVEGPSCALSGFFSEYLFVWLHWVSVVALGIFDLCCSLRDL